MIPLPTSVQTHLLAMPTEYTGRSRERSIETPQFSMPKQSTATQSSIDEEHVEKAIDIVQNQTQEQSTYRNAYKAIALFHLPKYWADPEYLSYLPGLVRSHNLSDELKQKHIKTNVALAEKYQGDAKTIDIGRNFERRPAEDFFSYRTISTTSGTTYQFRVLTHLDKEYHQALCVSHLAIASAFGDAKSSYQLAKIYQEGTYHLPLPINNMSKEDIAIDFAAKAHDQGDKTALINLGQLFENDQTLLGREKALKCYQDAIYGNSSPEPHTILARFFRQSDPTTAKKAATVAIALGNKNALIQLGMLYERDNTASGRENALSCYEIAVEEPYNHPSAALKLAKSYYKDEEKITAMRKVVIRSGDTTLRLAMGEWYLTRSYIYTDDHENECAIALLGEIKSIPDAYPQMKALAEKNQMMKNNDISDGQIELHLIKSPSVTTPSQDNNELS